MKNNIEFEIRVKLSIKCLNYEIRAYFTPWLKAIVVDNPFRRYLDIGEFSLYIKRS